MTTLKRLWTWVQPSVRLKASLFILSNASSLSGLSARFRTKLPFKTEKTPPVKTADALIIQCEDEWFWQQRQAHGLWGGLFCLPILENEHERLKLSQQFKLQPQPQTFQISHSFTHFTWLLNAHVFHVEPDQKNIWRLNLKANG